MKNTILLLMVLILFSGCLPNNNIANTNSEKKKSQDEAEDSIICTQDVKHCPQGFYISRTPPNCDFPACPEIEETKKLVKPIAEFDTRITKKPFGIYITPQNSPVQPEKFTGYHTGVDVEYGDVEKEVAVMAIADGEVLRSGWVSGYGGMLAIKHSIDGQDYIAIYGHLKPTSLVKNKSLVKAGDTIAVLGDGYSHDTDGERKHLHFAIYTSTDINVKGYVTQRSQLSAWLDPIEFFK